MTNKSNVCFIFIKFLSVKKKVISENNFVKEHSGAY